MEEKRFLIDQIYDFLMENSYERLDFVKNFPNSYIDFGKSEIYLQGSDSLKSYKLTLEEIENA
jgi:hypothetical protein